MIILITANFGFKSEEDVDSRLYNANLAGGALLDVGIYPILFSNFIMNDIPKELKASATMTRTGVDETDVIDLRYKDGALASLTCSIAAETGKIVIPTFWMAKEAYLYSYENEEKFEDKYNEAGYKYEIIEANNCIVNKVLESEIASHDVTLCLARIMDEIREQIGLVYPFE